MKENIIYILFAILPFISVFLIFLFFIKYRQHQKNNLRWLRLIIGNLLLFIFLISILIFGYIRISQSRISCLPRCGD